MIRDWIGSPIEWGEWGQRAGAWLNELVSRVNTTATAVDDTLLYTPGNDYALVRQTIAQSIPNATYTKMSFNVEENIPSDYDFLTSTDIEVPVSGVYLVEGSIRWSNNATGSRVMSIGVDSSLASDSVRRTIFENTPGSSTLVRRLSSAVRLNAGDLVSMYVYQASGAALLTSTGSDWCWMSVTRIR